MDMISDIYIITVFIAEGNTTYANANIAMIIVNWLIQLLIVRHIHDQEVRLIHTDTVNVALHNIVEGVYVSGDAMGAQMVQVVLKSRPCVSDRARQRAKQAQKSLHLPSRLG